MTTQFPGAIDGYTDPVGPQTLATNHHKQRHIDLQDAMVAVQTTVGVSGSADPNSIEYRVTQASAAASGTASALAQHAAAAAPHSGHATPESVAAAIADALDGYGAAVTPTSLGQAIAQCEALSVMPTGTNVVPVYDVPGGLPATALPLSVLDHYFASRFLTGEQNRSLRIVGCVLRNDGSGWAPMNDAGHRPVPSSGITVAADFNSVDINYGFTASKVITSLVVPDEVFATQRVFVGASVGLSGAVIVLTADVSIGGYVAWSGSAWTVAGDTTSASFNGAGKLTIEHPTQLSASILGLSAELRSGATRPSIEVFPGTAAAASFDVNLFDRATGAAITTPTTECKIYWSRVGSVALNPSTYVNAGANIWFLAVLECD